MIPIFNYRTVPLLHLSTTDCVSIFFAKTPPPSRFGAGIIEQENAAHKVYLTALPLRSIARNDDVVDNHPERAALLASINDFVTQELTARSRHMRPTRDFSVLPPLMLPPPSISLHAEHVPLNVAEYMAATMGLDLVVFGAPLCDLASKPSNSKDASHCTVTVQLTHLQPSTDEVMLQIVKREWTKRQWNLP